MKNVILLLSLAFITFCNNGTAIASEPVYMGLNGQFNSVEITYYTGFDKRTVKTKPFGNFQRKEVYTFDNAGYLSEKLTYADLAKKTLTAKDTYKRDKNGRAIEIYSGDNLNDSHYIIETLWRMIKKVGNVEQWQKINDNDSWGTSFQRIEYLGNKKETKSYVVQTKDKEVSTQRITTEIFNERGLVTSETVERGGSHPKNTTIKTYNDKGHLLKDELVQVYNDGSSSKTENASYTIDKVDAHGNPLQVTNDRGDIKIYKYSYRAIQ